MYVSPRPANKPVSRRLIFVDSKLKNSCIVQSIAIGINDNKHHNSRIFKKNTSGIAIISPIKTPVHLAQTGNW